MKRLAMVLLAVPILFAVLDGATTTYLFLRQPGTEDTSGMFPVLFPAFGAYWAVANALLELAVIAATYACLFVLLRWARGLSEGEPAELPAWARAVVDYLPAAATNWVTYLVAPAVVHNLLRIAALPPAV